MRQKSATVRGRSSAVTSTVATCPNQWVYIAPTHTAPTHTRKGPPQYEEPCV